MHIYQLNHLILCVRATGLCLPQNWPISGGQAQTRSSCPFTCPCSGDSTHGPGFSSDVSNLCPQPPPWSGWRLINLPNLSEELALGVVDFLCCFSGFNPLIYYFFFSSSFGCDLLISPVSQWRTQIMHSRPFFWNRSQAPRHQHGAPHTQGVVRGIFFSLNQDNSSFLWRLLLGPIDPDVLGSAKPSLMARPRPPGCAWSPRPCASCLAFLFCSFLEFPSLCFIIHLLLCVVDIVRESPWLVSVEILNDWSDPSRVPTGPRAAGARVRAACGHPVTFRWKLD